MGDVVEPVFPLIRYLKFLNNTCRVSTGKCKLCVLHTPKWPRWKSTEICDPRQGVPSALAARLLFCCAFPGTALCIYLAQLSFSK